MSICLIGCLWSIYEGEVESLTFDKKSETFLVRYTNIVCKKRYHCHPLKDITSIRAVSKGRKGPNETQHYILCIYLKNDVMIKVLFSKNSTRI